ncbi:Uncharacterised protein [Streptococcus pneumoniae]|nr:Uncharacterised protein [Streptococcus pneumoniae]
MAIGLGVHLLEDDREVCLQSKGSQHRFCPFCWQIRYVELRTQLLDAKLFQFEVQHLIVSQER